MLQYQWKELKRRLQSNQVLKISKSLNVWSLRKKATKFYMTVVSSVFSGTVSRQPLKTLNYISWFCWFKTITLYNNM